MNRILNHGAPVEVSESVVEFLMMEIVEYFMRGHGSRAFLPPNGAEVDTDNPIDKAATLITTRRRIEAVGQDVGLRLVERYALERDRMDAELDIIKFICKDLWEHAFKKQIDVLQTNHRGLYVLTDNNFRWLAKVSVSGDDHSGMPEDYLAFPCGMVSGALTRLGLKCRVTAELTQLTSAFKCSFSVQVLPN